MYEGERQKRREKRLKKRGKTSPISPPSANPLDDVTLQSPSLDDSLALSTPSSLTDTGAEVEDKWETSTVAESTIEDERRPSSSSVPKLTFSNAKEDSRPKQTNVLITVSGWIARGKDDHALPFLSIEQGVHGDQYALIWESKELLALYSALSLFYAETASFIVQQTLQVCGTDCFNIDVLSDC